MMTLRREQENFMRDFYKLLGFIFSLGYTVTGGELERDEQRQNKLFIEHKTKTLQSNHLTKTAIDINIFDGDNLLTAKIEDRDKLIPIADFWEGLGEYHRSGVRWRNPDFKIGINFYDPRHFEINWYRK